MDGFPTDAWIIAGGCLIGFLIGMTGVGAGSQTTPLLITGFGLLPTDGPQEAALQPVS
jgi:uncharacterized membrane protein YfcA